MIDVQCTNCRVEHQVDDSFAHRAIECDACGQPFIARPAGETDDSSTTSSQNVELPANCPRCSTRRGEGAVICVNCGFDFETGAAAYLPDDAVLHRPVVVERPWRGPAIKFGIIGGVVLLIAVGVIITLTVVPKHMRQREQRAANEAWTSATALSGDERISALTSFIHNHPNASQQAQAERMLLDEQLWQDVQSATSIDASIVALQRYQNTVGEDGAYLNTVLAWFEEAEAWKETTSPGPQTINALQLQRDVDALRGAADLSRLVRKITEWQAIHDFVNDEAIQQCAAIDAFLLEHAEGRFAAAARAEYGRAIRALRGTGGARRILSLLAYAHVTPDEAKAEQATSEAQQAASLPAQYEKIEHPRNGHMNVSLRLPQPDPIWILHDQAWQLFDVGEAMPAETKFRDAIRAAERASSSRADRAVMQASLGACLSALHRYDDAQHELQSAHAALIEHAGQDDVRTLRVREMVLDLYDVWNKPELAVQFSDAHPLPASDPKPGTAQQSTPGRIQPKRIQTPES